MFTRYSSNVPKNYSGNAFRSSFQGGDLVEKNHEPNIYQSGTRLTHSPSFSAVNDDMIKNENEQTENTTYDFIPDDTKEEYEPYNEEIYQYNENTNDDFTYEENIEEFENNGYIENENEENYDKDINENSILEYENTHNKIAPQNQHTIKNILSDIKSSSLWNMLSKASTDEMILAGLILLIANDNNKSNDDIIMLLAILLLKA